jgi:uncharacterized protein YodC (DUF2158 family)
MAAFKKGDEVKLKAVIPAGPVMAMRMDEDGIVSYLIEWDDLEGVAQQRWFTEDQLVAG